MLVKTVYRLPFQEVWPGREEQRKRKSKLRSGAEREGVDLGF